MTKATHLDKELVVNILVSAFSSIQAGNQINLIVKQDKHRLKRMHVFMEYMFENAMLFGEVFISDNRQACLLIKYAHKEKVTLKTIGLDLRLAFKSIGITRVFKVLKRQWIAKKNYPKEPHIQPMIMGVNDEYKGKGTAPRLMFEIRDHFKDNTLPVIIDTVTDSNLKMYKRFGFRITKKYENFDFPIYFLRLN